MSHPNPAAAPQRTPLFESHLACHGKMVDFAGWEMPINYGSQIDEHHAVRNDAGMFDVSHMCALDLTGADATRWLRHLLANDVAKLTTPGKALYSCMLNDEAGVIDDLIVYYFSADHFRIVVNAGTADKDIAWMQSHLTGFDCALKVRRDLAMIAVQGPNAREKFWQAFPDTRTHTESLMVFQGAILADRKNWLVARTGYTGEDGFEITLPAGEVAVVWQALVDAGIKPCGLGARDTLRLEAGMNLYGQDMDETVSPYDAGLKWTVDTKDAARNFIGQLVLATRRCDYQFSGLLMLDRGVLRAHQKVITLLGEGEITSGTFSPSLNQSIALARLPAGVAIGTEVEVEIRDKKLKARVVKPSFVRHGKPV